MPSPRSHRLRKPDGDWPTDVDRVCRIDRNDLKIHPDGPVRNTLTAGNIPDAPDGEKVMFILFPSMRRWPS
jgi:hypothetical protein